MVVLVVLGLCDSPIKSIKSKSVSNRLYIVESTRSPIFTMAARNAAVVMKSRFVCEYVFKAAARWAEVVIMSKSYLFECMC